MGDRNGRPQAPASAEEMFGPARPAFGRARRGRGYDPADVRPYLDMLERERADLGAALVLTQARVRELTAKLERYEALEQELTRSVRLAKETAAAVVADAEARAAALRADAEAEAARLVAEGHAKVAEEQEGLNALHMAIAAEASALAALEESAGFSRAAAALVEIVDGPGGLGPFSQATSTLLEFAQLLQRTARNGSTTDAPAGIAALPAPVLDLAAPSTTRPVAVADAREPIAVD